MFSNGPNMGSQQWAEKIILGVETCWLSETEKVLGTVKKFMQTEFLEMKDPSLLIYLEKVLLQIVLHIAKFWSNISPFLLNSVCA